MRRWFDHLPIHQKLVTLALLIAAVALLVVTLGLGAFDVWRDRGAAEEDAGALARILADNTTAAVVFNQPEAAEELLQSVRARQVVTRACIFLPSGELFAAFARGPARCPARPAAESNWTRVAGSAAITRDGRTHGTVYVERDLSDLRERLLLTSLVAIVMLGFAALAAHVLAERVNVAISEPISRLASFARGFGADSAQIIPDIRSAPDELGDLVNAFGDMVTRIKRANEELRQSNDALRREKAEREAASIRERETERRFHTLADGSPVLLWVNGAEGCEFVNRAYLEFVGLATDTQVRGYDWSRFLHPDDADAYVSEYQRCYRARIPFRAEFRFLRADGEWRWMRSEATPRVENGVFLGFVGASVDITERKQAEQALREADHRKDAFLAVLAHELRNPLAPIRTGLEILRVGGDKPDTMGRIRPVLERQVGHMVRLIDDLLDVSRITSGKIQLQRQPTPLRELVDAAVDAHRSAIEAAGLTLSVNLPDTPCILDVDPTRFVQVLSNLLNNATKFTERGGGIRIDAAVDERRERPVLTLAVADTGAGIPAALLPHVFEFFVQGEVRQQLKSGLGIGLGLAKQLIELHHGEIAARSDGPGRGSTFTITLPVLTWESVGGSAAPSAADVRVRIDRRVLVIDDNVDAADTLSALVVALGGEAQAVYDGRSGLRRASQFRPDVILLDIGMPDMDGYETCRRLRAEPFGKHAYIVAVTGWGQQHDRQRALANGFDAHLTKPANPRVLAGLLSGVAAIRDEVRDG